MIIRPNSLDAMEEENVHLTITLWYRQKKSLVYTTKAL